MDNVDDNPLLTEDPLTGLPWSETLLPLVMNWAAGRTVQAVCFHFVGLGILANLKEFQTSQSVLREAGTRITSLLGDDDRLTRLSANKLLLFSTRPDAEVGGLTQAIRGELASLGTEVNGQRIPQIRIGRARLEPPEHPPVTMDALNTLIASAEGAAVPVTDPVVSANGAGDVQPDQPGQPSRESAGDVAQPQVMPSVAPRETVTLAISDPKSTPREETERIMIIRGHPERTALRHPEEAPTVQPPEPEPTGEHRLVLNGVEVLVTGLVATAMVDLQYEDRAVRGKAIGRSSEQHHAELVAEAMTRAVTDLLPAGHGAVFRQAVSASTDFGDALVTVVEFLTPDSDAFLFGVAPVDGEPLKAVAKSILSAVNHRTARLLDGESA